METGSSRIYETRINRKGIEDVSGTKALYWKIRRGKGLYLSEDGKPPRTDCRCNGTGKTVSLRVLAESFSDCGVSVFLADAKGDLASMSLKGTGEGSVGGRVENWDLKKKDLPIMLIR